MVNLKRREVVNLGGVCTLEVAKLQNTDNFGHDYTVYVNRLEEEQVTEPAPAPKKQTKKSKAKKQETTEVPF